METKCFSLLRHCSCDFSVFSRCFHGGLFNLGITGNVRRIQTILYFIFFVLAFISIFKTFCIVFYHERKVKQMSDNLKYHDWNMNVFLDLVVRGLIKVLLHEDQFHSPKRKIFSFNGTFFSSNGGTES